MNQTPRSAESGPDEDDDSAAAPPPRRTSRFPSSARWTIVFTVVILALVIEMFIHRSLTFDDLPGVMAECGVSRRSAK